MMYWVWKVRNEQIFKNMATTPLMLVQLIQNDIRLKLGEMTFKMKRSQERDEMQKRWGVNIQEQQLNREWTVWWKPLTDFHMPNLDGSWRNGKGFYGCVIGNQEGRVLREVRGKAKSKSTDSTNMEVLRHGQVLANKYGIERLQVNADSDTVIQYVTKNKAPWDTVCHTVTQSQLSNQKLIFQT